MTLTDTAIRAANAAEKQQKLFDGNGLYLLIFPTGSKIWRFKYRFQGKEKLISLGAYPAVSLKDARDKAAEARKLLGGGNDPSAERKLAKIQHQNTFESIALEWYGKQTPKWTDEHAKKTKRRLELDIFPYIGSRPVANIMPSELLTLIHKIEERGSLTIARYVRSLCSNIFRFAVITGRAERDPAADIQGAISVRTIKNYAAITDPFEAGKLLLAIDRYHASFTVRNALRFLPLVFCRPGELRKAEWSEFDFEDKVWRIPGEKMKMSRDHIIPLSIQSISILNDMYKYSGNDKYVFPSPQRGAPIQGHSTFVNALRRMGYSKDQMCAHGFRAMASTLLNELGYPPEVIERQLAHVDRNKVRAAYNRAEYLPERRKMMQDWADY